MFKRRDFGLGYAALAVLLEVLDFGTRTFPVVHAAASRQE
jgi:hypothetical protein